MRTLAALLTGALCIATATVAVAQQHPRHNAPAFVPNTGQRAVPQGNYDYRGRAMPRSFGHQSFRRYMLYNGVMQWLIVCLAPDGSILSYDYCEYSD